MISIDDIGKRVRILNSGDIAINWDLRKFLYDDANEYPLFLERITKGGRAIVRHGKHTYSLAPKYIKVFN
jgi:hypothetical protein